MLYSDLQDTETWQEALKETAVLHHNAVADRDDAITVDDIAGININLEKDIVEYFIRDGYYQQFKRKSYSLRLIFEKQ